MTHYRLRDRLPSVIVTNNRSETKVYDTNKVYLNNGDNFELRFFNPLQEKIGIEIIFNGISKGDSKLILRPGEDITLDRFLNENAKMKFDTYQIDGNNSDAVKAAEKNGLIEIKFYKEQQNNWSTFGCCNFNSTAYGGTGTFNSPGVFTSSCDTLGTTTLGTNLDGEITESKSVETGRVEKGEESKQQLQHENITFDNYPFHTVTYELNPVSSKPQTINEVRNYCTGCAYRIRKQNWKFCPKCGEKL